jgi:hypothetical protein
MSMVFISSSALGLGERLGEDASWKCFLLEIPSMSRICNALLALS